MNHNNNMIQYSLHIYVNCLDIFYIDIYKDDLKMGNYMVTLYIFLWNRQYFLNIATINVYLPENTRVFWIDV